MVTGSSSWDMQSSSWPSDLGISASHCLKEEGYASGVTLVARVAGPGFGHGAGAGAAFAADYQPVDAFQVEVGEGA